MGRKESNQTKTNQRVTRNCFFKDFLQEYSAYGRVL